MNGKAMARIVLVVLVGAGILVSPSFGETYAEKLGWPEGTRALILHIDDAGMSYDSDLGTISAIEDGVANSLSEAQHQLGERSKA